VAHDLDVARVGWSWGDTHVAADRPAAPAICVVPGVPEAVVPEACPQNQRGGS